MSELLKVNNIRKGQILNGISFELKKGEMTAIMGPSGSGKSTLLYNVSGMDTADGGEVFLQGKEIRGLSEDEKASIRLKNMGFVFQQMNCLSNLNLIDNIVFPAVHADRKNREEYYARAKELMAKFHIEDLAERRVNEVSGGQLQRACICRSMIMKPEILFADEPTGALNQSASGEVMDAFLKINSEGTSILMVTHDSRVASKCERVLYILDGEIRGELNLGKYDASMERDREQQTARWLESLGW
ncbi:ABC transporter ATP-binding protein [Butyrivibrio sp. CB08]|uniref:ABC transporter ATP-binding protein n=1 Tax=Butyrivibrio sp. CB08 TaxID=2364879 RepID=UPI000EA98A81|nr:ABC transporter ATP-binding protein [Butyrivibrio sp. CB08]RKM61249.1 ABC transporter ATP-binding protein [Butyrivibrio sp. CB08]